MSRGIRGLDQHLVDSVADYCREYGRARTVEHFAQDLNANTTSSILTAFNLTRSSQSRYDLDRELVRAAGIRVPRARRKASK